MRYAFLVAALALFGSASAQEGWTRYRVYVDNEFEAQVLTDSELGLFSEQVAVGTTDVIVGPKQLPELLRLGLDFEYVSDLPPADAWRDRVSPQLDDYRYAYLPYNDIIAQYEIWRLANPAIVTRTRIGTSWNNRAIWAYRISNAKTPTSQVANVVIIGGIHAREWVSPSVAMYLTDTLIDKIKNEPAYGNLMQRAALYVVPSLNPDGYVHTWTNNRYWRKNRRNNGGSYGVDLNRNLATGWGFPGASSNASSDTYRGPSAFSEPETRALRDLVLGLPNVAGFIDFHSYSQLTMWPWGYLEPLCAHDAIHRRIGNRMSAAIQAQSGMVYNTGPIYTTIYPASGTTVDYMYNPINAISLTIELRDTGQFGFLLPENQILPTQMENWEGFRSFLFDVVARTTGGVPR